MSIGSENKSVHIIDEVVFDFSFASNLIADDHESVINLWVVNELLPVIEAVLDEHDDVNKVLRIENINIDLGDIAEDDHAAQIVQRLHEQLKNQISIAKQSKLSERRADGRHSLPVAIGQEEVQPVAGLNALEISSTQARVEQLIHFLLTGNFPWYVEMTQANVHLNIMDIVLQATEGPEIFIASLLQLPSASQSIVIQRFVYQFSNGYLEKFLRQIVSKSNYLDGLLELVNELQTVRATETALTSSQHDPIKQLWIQLFTYVFEHQRAQKTPPLSEAIHWILESVATRMSLDRNTLISRLIHGVRKSPRASVLTEILSGAAAKLQVDRSSDAEKRDMDYSTTDSSIAEALHDSFQSVEPKTIRGNTIAPIDHLQSTGDLTDQDGVSISYDEVLCHQFLSELKQTGISVVIQQPDGSHSFVKQALQIRLQQILRDDTRRTQLIAKLPETALLDMVYLYTPAGAAILEQVLQQAGKLYQRTARKRFASITAWKQQLWENALRFIASVATEPSEARPINLPHFTQALTHQLTDTMQSWHQALQIPVETAKADQSVTVLQNILQEAQTSLAAPHPNPNTTTETAEQVQQLLTGLVQDFKATQQRLIKAVRSGKLRLSGLSESMLKNLVEALLEHDPHLASADQQTFIDAIATHAHQAVNRKAYYQHILEKLLNHEDIDLEIVAAETVQARKGQITQGVAGERPVQASPTLGVIEQQLLIALKQTGMDAIVSQPLAATSLSRQLRQILRDDATRTQLIAKLPETALLDMVYLYTPAGAAILEQVLQQAGKLYQRTARKRFASITAWKQQLWENALRFIASVATEPSEARPINLPHFTQALTHQLTDTIQSWLEVLKLLPAGGATVLQHLLQQGIFLQKNRDHQTTQLPDSQSFALQFSDQPGWRDTRAFTDRDPDIKAGDVFYIHNAGQVLAGPYLPRLFNMLGLLTNGVFTNWLAAERAVHLLQYMVNEQTASAEYQLLLNKILCGLSTGIPVCHAIEINPNERETITSLLNGMILNWKVIGQTSISGLRETFLQRKGSLQLKEDIWYLTIEPGPYDMLLDQLPWGFSVIKHHWMDRSIHVTWR